MSGAAGDGTTAPRRIAREQWQRQPWKNGGGTTHEVWREGAGPPGFALRVSCAEVAVDGPFSSFPGVDRTILLLDGAGFALRRDDGVEVLLREVGAPFRFRGEERWDCALVAGPVLDLNLMVARDVARAALTVVSVGAGEARVVGDDHASGEGGGRVTRVLVLALDDGLAVAGAGGTLPRWTTVIADGPVALRADAAARAVVVVAALPG